VSTPAERERRCVVCHTTYAGNERFCPLDGGAIVADAESGTGQIGRTIDGRYLVRRLIGHGGMGAVYEAEHIGLDRTVAIKFLLGDTTDRDMLARFRQEARTASRVVHDHVVQIYDVGQDETGLDFIAMEYLEGTDLRAVIEAGALAPARAVKIMQQLLAGLHAIHQSGILHRDVKPANVLLVERDGDPDFVKLTDFGIAKPADASAPQLTDTGKVVGTPQYMAPEQLTGDGSDHRADLYAAGLTLYEMLAGTAPFVSSASAQLIAMQLTQAPPSLAVAVPGLPPALIAAVDRALAKDPDKRWADAPAFAAALTGEGASEDGATQADRPASKRSSVARKITAPTATDRPATRPRSMLRLVVGCGLAIGAAFGLVLLLRGHGSSSPAPADAGRIAAVVAPDASTAPTLAQHLAYADAAENEGKLELAIAALEEAAKLDPGAKLRMRLAGLHERLGHRAETARYLHAYLDAAPQASDRASVLARLSALEAPVAVGAGGAEVANARPRIAAAKPKMTVPAGSGVPVATAANPTSTCVCTPNSFERAHSEFLCDVRSTLECRCQAKDGVDLCARWIPCAPGSQDDCGYYYPGVRCSTKSVLEATLPGPFGAPCKGYAMPNTPELDGAQTCSMACPDPHLEFHGESGKACAGYDRETGERIDGHLAKCWRPEPP
jgi:serine/threonine-protein kinase